MVKYITSVVAAESWNKVRGENNETQMNEATKSVETT